MLAFEHIEYNKRAKISHPYQISYWHDQVKFIKRDWISHGIL